MNTLPKSAPACLLGAYASAGYARHGHHDRLGRTFSHLRTALDNLEPGAESRGTWDDHTALGTGTQIILSFDVEEHFRIEAAARLELGPGLKAACSERLVPSTRWLLDQLDRTGHKATFFIVGQIAKLEPTLIREIHRAGHEVASHGWDHRRILEMDAATFREDVRRSKDALEQVTGEPVVGYRAPTFSIVKRTGWALDVLAELGMLYDSSIYPVNHDRYGIAHAPRAPFLAQGPGREILELPPVTLRVGGANAPVGGGGYFRLLPLFLMEKALAQVQRDLRPAVAMLYFHPWEFDPEQPRLPLRTVSRFRTYVGIARSQSRLGILLSRHQFARAVDVARQLNRQRQALSKYKVAE